MKEIELFTAFINNHNIISYGVLFLAMIIEGEFFLMTSGIFVRIGAFNPVYAFAVALLGTLAGDVLWYFIGVIIKEKFSEISLVKRAEEKVKRFFPSFQKNPSRALFISKFIAGTNHPVLLFSGFLRIKFARFIKIQLKASLLWTMIFFFIGYIYGYAAIVISRKLDKFLISSLALIIIAIILDKIIFRKYYKK